MKEAVTTLISFVLPYLLFISVRSDPGYEGQEGCYSSCGELRDIRYPFRLKSDRANCGDRNYELECHGNNTFLEILPGKYLVTNIFYESSKIEIVHVGFMNGSCNLPLQSLSISFKSGSYNPPLQYVSVSKSNSYNPPLQNLSVSFSTDSYIAVRSWAVFINCSSKIEDYGYRPILCLSQNNRFVYVTSRYSVDALLPSCSYLTMVPIPLVNISSIAEDYLFQILHNRFNLSLVQGYRKPTSFMLIRRCLRAAPQDARDYMESEKKWKWLIYPYLLEFEFVDCITYSGRDYALYGPSLLLIVFIDVATLLLVLGTLGRFIIAPLSICVFLSYELWKILAPIDTVEKFLRNQQTAMPTRYAYTEIIQITRNFKEKLGQGGFGSVYKGELPGGYLVAVKMLGNSKCNGEDFINEVSTIGMIHHVNVVRLVGFCSEGSDRALVYEFMCNGSLDKHIFSSNGTNCKFTTKKLNEIALGVSRGIDYLHRGCDMRILHFDIKPHNILLDHNFNPKVSDFGLAKLYPKDYSLVSTCAARGTIGYMAPELVSRSFGLISHKSDVYSFGMLLLEMAGGRRNVDYRAEKSSRVYYPSWIYDKLDQTESLGFCNDIEIDNVERKLCKVGLWCIQMRPSFRPTMSRVIEMLEGDVDGVEMPPKPFLFSSTPSARRQSAVDSSLLEISIRSWNKQNGQKKTIRSWNKQSRNES